MSANTSSADLYWSAILDGNPPFLRKNLSHQRHVRAYVTCELLKETGIKNKGRLARTIIKRHLEGHGKSIAKKLANSKGEGLNPEEREDGDAFLTVIRADESLLAARIRELQSPSAVPDGLSASESRIRDDSDEAPP
jgi:hypothetical protein